MRPCCLAVVLLMGSSSGVFGGSRSVGDLSSASPIEKELCSIGGFGAPNFKEAREASLQHLGEVIGILGKKQLSGCWYEAAMILGANGTLPAVKAIEGFVAADRGSLTKDQWEGKGGAMIALGWAANRAGKSGDAGSREALRYLFSTVDRGRRIHWAPPPMSTRKEAREDLIVRAIQGLGLSGSDEARAFLTTSARCKDSRFKDTCSFAQHLLDDTSKPGGLEKMYH